jgi:hypothetical protein
MLWHNIEAPTSHYKNKVVPYTGRLLLITRKLTVYFRNIFTQKEQSAVFMHWRFSSRRNSKTFCSIKLGPIPTPNNNEKIQWSTCQGDSSGLEEGIPWQIWCPCYAYLARACMQHVPVLTQLYFTEQLSSITCCAWSALPQQSPTSYKRSVLFRLQKLKSLTHLMVWNVAIKLLGCFYCVAYRAETRTRTEQATISTPPSLFCQSLSHPLFRDALIACALDLSGLA